jgi:transglutaminase-like putative cysteine protease
MTSAKGNNTSLLEFLRILLAASITIFLTRSADFGTAPSLLVLAAITGTWLAYRMLQRERTFFRALRTHLILIVTSTILFYLAQRFSTSLFSDASEYDFLVSQIENHVYLTAFVYGFFFLSTWAFWTLRWVVTFELIAFSSLFVWLLGAHRNYHLDAPKKISELAFESGFAPQVFLLVLAVSFCAVVAIYIGLSSTRTLFTKELVVATEGQKRPVLTMLTTFLLMLLLVGYAWLINKNYSENLSRAMQGVGQEDQTGKSPLGFHSAVGQTKQPAALLRLEGDYEKNPWYPMLYLREGALSEFSGQELVIASPEFDTDVPRIKPGQTFVKSDVAASEFRTEVVQSVYLLSDHTAPFAIDYPRSLRLISNPDDDRFKLSYQAISVAPTVELAKLVGEAVGDSNWDQKTWAHYLRAPGSKSETALAAQQAGETPDFSAPILDKFNEDQRYREFVESITNKDDAPIIKAMMISDYLSKNSIYTRKPGHEQTERGDPVAPYLFAKEKRGYCVHFAHAAVYLMRLVGVPARIATGYLTDLQYAKDGHVLLHLGDRHAWPEVYVQGHGWVVMDVTPAQAENEQVIVPDEKLLEELMSKINPAEEMLTPPPLSEEKTSISDKVIAKVLNTTMLWVLLIVGVFTWSAIKLWLRFGYLLASDPRTRVKRAYTAFASLMTDLGLNRKNAETRAEYMARLESRFGVNAKGITMLLEQASYQRSFSNAELANLKQNLNEALIYPGKYARAKRILSFFSPASVSSWNKW